VVGFMSCKSLWHVKHPPGMRQILRRQKSRSFLATFIQLRYQMSLLVVASELWWTNQELLELR
jgi:hypothetical protein